MEICKDAKRTLPRPKVGDFCSIAMEQGFSDVCLALCMEETVVSRIAQACRGAAVEQPRPTVRRWCEHGYMKAFEITQGKLRNHFDSVDVITEPEPAQETPREDVEGANEFKVEVARLT